LSVQATKPKDKFPPLLLSEPDAATACGVSRPVFRSWRAEGLIAPVTLPGNIRRNLYRYQDVERLVSSFVPAS
jgi:predicted site-specific integrase-resolvase